MAPCRPAGGAFLAGANVVVTATPSAGWRFDHWSGDLAGNNTSPTLTMDANKSVTAHFVQTFALTTSVTGSGTVSPSGGTYDAGTVIALTATADPGFAFYYWEGGLTGSTNPASVTMDGNKSVTAVMAPNVYFIAGASTEAETAGSGPTLTVELSVASAQPVTVPYTLSGTAGDGSDFTIAASPLVFNAGETSKEIAVTLLDDTLDEVAETLVVTLGAPTNALLGATTAHTMTITDDEPTPTVAFSVNASSSNESTGTASLSVALSTASGLEVTVPYTVTGTAADGTDYVIPTSPLVIPAGDPGKDITVVLVNDLLDEADETLVVTLGTPSNAELGVETVHALTIHDNDPTPTVYFDLASSIGNELSGTPVQIAVFLSAASGQTVTVPYTVTGTAVDGTDYTVDASPLVFNAGDSSKTLELTMVNDANNEYDETVVVTLGTPTNADLGALTTHTFTLVDDDSIPDVNFDLAASTEAESIGTVHIDVSLSIESGKEVTVPYLYSGTAIDGTALGEPAADGPDYIVGGNALVFAVGEKTKTISIDIVDDLHDESDETLILTLAAPTNGNVGATPAHTLTLTDNDFAPTVRFALANTSVDESAGRSNLALTLSSVSGQTISVPYTVTGTAENSGQYIDFGIANSPLVFAPGETSKTISVTIVSDISDEENESVIVTLNTPTNGGLGTIAAHTMIIVDNDDPPTVAVTEDLSAGSSVPESYGTVFLPVALSAPSCKQVTIPYTVTGTAQDGTDFTITPSPIVFACYEGGKFIEIPIIDDMLHEADETVIITLSSLVNADYGIDTVYTLTIIDDDPPPVVSLPPDIPPVIEASGEVIITVTLDQPSGGIVSVPYTYTTTSSGGSSGGGGGCISCTSSASSGGGTIYFAPGTTTQTITITLSDDAASEGGEDIEISLGEGDGVELGVAEVVVPVVDDDSPPNVFFAVNISDVGEGDGTATIEVQMGPESGQTVTVDYGVTGGTATGAGVDYSLASGTVTFEPGELSKLITVPIVDDTFYEGNETAVVTLTNPVNSNLGVPSTHTLTIVENEPAPTVRFIQASSSVSEIESSATLDVELLNPTALDTTVTFGVSSQATINTEYTLSASPITFPAGQTTATITVNLLDDTLDENDEQIIVTLTTTTNGVLGTPYYHTLTVLDDDPEPDVSFVLADSSMDEAGLPGPIDVDIQLSTLSGREVIVPLVLSGTAVENADYLVNYYTLVIPAGTLATKVAVTPVEDLLDEADETVILTIDPPINAVRIVPSVHTVTIQDNDLGPTIDFSQSSSFIDESAGGAPLEVALTNPAGRTVTIDYAVTAGTTASGSSVDYSLLDGTLSFAAGEVTKTIDVTIINDLIQESDEFVEVTLSGPVNGLLGTPNVHTVTITDNDFVLTAASADPSMGAVTLTPPGGIYEGGTEVSIAAVPATGYALNYWTGHIGGGVSPQTLVINADKSVTAHFGPGSTLTTAVTGNGTVSPSNGAFLTNSTISLTATADLGWRLDHWEGDLTNNTNPAPLTMTGDMSVTAFFIEVCQITIVNDPNSGTVTQSPLPGADGNYAIGETITLTATGENYTDYDYIFDYWQGLPEDDYPTGPAGPGTSSANPLSYNVKGPRVVGPVWKKRYRLTTDTIGSGSVSPGGGVKEENSIVTMSANSGGGTGFLFHHWEGDLSGTENPKDLFMGAPKHVIAVFLPKVECGDPISSVNESVGNTSIVVTLPDYDQVVTVPYTIAGNATNGLDYVINPADASPLVFQPGETSKLIDVAIVDDTLFETNEVIVITLGSPANALPGPTAFHTMTIVDNDPIPTVEFDAANSTAGEDTYLVDFTVSLSDPSGQTITVDYLATGGTASDSLDYECGNAAFVPWSDDFDDLDITDWTTAGSWTAAGGFLENTGSVSDISNVQPNNDFPMDFDYRATANTVAHVHFREDASGDSLELKIDNT